MDRKIAGLLGAAAALTTVTGAHAAVSAQTSDFTTPSNYQELLNPVANPVAALKADDARRIGQTSGSETAQYHHHHHHHHHWRRRHHHHHHHHHYMG